MTESIDVTLLTTPPEGYQERLAEEHPQYFLKAALVGDSAGRGLTLRQPDKGVYESDAMRAVALAIRTAATNIGEDPELTHASHDQMTAVAVGATLGVLQALSRRAGGFPA